MASSVLPLKSLIQSTLNNNRTSKGISRKLELLGIQVIKIIFCLIILLEAYSVVVDAK